MCLSVENNTFKLNVKSFFMDYSSCRINVRTQIDKLFLILLITSDKYTTWTSFESINGYEFEHDHENS